MPTPTPSSRSDLFRTVLKNRIAILDGAMGTMVHALALDEGGFRGERFSGHHRDLKNCIDVLTLTQGEAIRGIHASYLAAGADIIETNTFGATTIAQDDYDLGGFAFEMNLASAKIARSSGLIGTTRTACSPPWCSVFFARTVRRPFSQFTSAHVTAPISDGQRSPPSRAKPTSSLHSADGHASRTSRIVSRGM